MFNASEASEIPAAVLVDVGIKNRAICNQRVSLSSQM
jgi:hypothetical protein